MYRIKLGDHITVGNVSKGPRIVLECDDIRELDFLIQSEALDHLIDIAERRSDLTRALINRL